jgi:alkaline phosphatase
MKNLILLFLFTSTLFCQTKEQSPNIILMIGDGMGLTQISAGMYANKNQTVLEEFEHIGLSKTHSADQLVTD